MNGETKANNRDNIHNVGGRTFVSLHEGRFAGMYVITSERMEAFYANGSFWSLDSNPSSTRENQLLSVMKGNFSKYYPQGGWQKPDEFVVPLDETGHALGMIAGVHHQSDKYARLPWPFGKLCVQNIFMK